MIQGRGEEDMDSHMPGRWSENPVILPFPDAELEILIISDPCLHGRKKNLRMRSHSRASKPLHFRVFVVDR